MIYLLVEHTDNLQIFNQAKPVPCHPEDLPFSLEAVLSQRDVSQYLLSLYFGMV
jgi:hypothetical protein